MQQMIEISNVTDVYNQDDMYLPRQRSRPMAMFSFIAILGTVIAPVYAGFIAQHLGWRWIQGIQGIANIPLLICIFVFFPETRGGKPVLAYQDNRVSLTLSFC